MFKGKVCSKKRIGDKNQSTEEKMAKRTREGDKSCPSGPSPDFVHEPRTHTKVAKPILGSMSRVSGETSEC